MENGPGTNGRPTLLDLVSAVCEASEDEAEALVTLAYLFASGAVRLAHPQGEGMLALEPGDWPTAA